MITVIAVEPNDLLRLGILNVLEKMALEMTSTGLDYAQLFAPVFSPKSVDLMLLSVPDTDARLAELVAAAQRGYAPKNILLLSNNTSVTHPRLDLPPIVAGYISKYASRTVLDASIRLVLAGGKCFPVQNSSSSAEHRSDGDGAHKPGASSRRRWYDRSLPVPANPDARGRLPANLLASVALLDGAPQPTASGARIISIVAGETWPLPPALIASEAKVLGLTTRQFEILALLARGYPIKSISRNLGISTATVKVHCQTLYQRLAVHNRSAAVHAAFERGATLGWSRRLAG